MLEEVEQQQQREEADNKNKDSNSNQTKRRRRSINRTAQRQRRTKVQQLRILTEIRQKMLEGVNTNNEIMEFLGISKRTFYRYMDRMYIQDKEQLEKKNEETRATTINLQKDRMLHLLQNTTDIAEDPKVSAKDRIKADWARRDIILDLLKLEFEGPTATKAI